MALADSVLLATDLGFQGRVMSAVIAMCESIMTESITVATVNLYLSRRRFAAQIMQNPSQWQTQFAAAVAADPNVVYAATYGLSGAPAAPTLTTGNLAAQAASILDSIITTSVVDNFNVFFLP